VFAQLEAEHSNISRLARHISFARNQEFVAEDVELADRDELAFIPPVSGGA
jgi:molybdopterin converting factor small subunit